MTRRVLTMWFDTDVIGPVEKYREVAADIWDAWLRQQGDATTPD